MTLELSKYGVDAVDSGEIRAERNGLSAVLRAGRSVALPLTGTLIRTVSGIKSYGVGEGKAKTASGTNSSFKILPNKFVTGQVLTQEALKFDSNVADVLYALQPSSHTKYLDEIVMGIAPVPADFVGFGTLAGAQVAEIGTGMTALTDMDEAEALVATNGFNELLSTTTFLSYLNRQRVGDAGNKAFDIQYLAKTPGTPGPDATFNGKPVYLVKSNVSVAFGGDFSKLNHGEVALTTEEAYQLKDQGNITDSDGVEHNLTAENKVLFLNEAMYGVGVEGIANFVKLVPAPVV